MLCATILVAPQLFGGAFPWTVVVIAGLCVASLGTALWVRRSAATPVFDGVFVVMGVAWLWTCLQAVPLPSEVARALGSGSVQSAERLQGLAWADAIKFTISYEPGSTHLQILIGVGVLSAFLAARLGGASGLKPIAVTTVVSAVLMGLVGFAHEAAGADVLFGVYAPRFTITRLLAPLMNSNHLAGFSLTGALIAAGLAAQGDNRQKQIAWIAASVFCTIVVAWTLSRGAIGALLFGFMVLAAWLVRRRQSHGRGAAIPVAVVGSAIAGMVAFAGLEPILRRFETEGLDKLTVAARGLRLLEGSAWFLGVGRGAFSSAFVTHEGSTDRYTHPENLLVQWTTEWGVPVAIVLLLVLTIALWRRFRSAEDPLTAAVCIAIFALSLQNLVDFSLEMAGVVVVVAAMLGSVLPAKGKSHPQRSRRLLLASFGVFVTALVALGPRVRGSDTQSIVDRLTQYMQADDEVRFEAALRRGLALHPGEPSLALLAGAYAGSKRHPDAARWLSVVMEEAPEWAAPHAVAARWLSSEGKIDQALLEIRHAEQRRAGSAYKVTCELLARSPRMDYVLRAAPAQDQRIAFLNRTVSTCGRLPADLRAEIDDAILKADPTHAAAVLRAARRLATQGRSNDAVDLLQRSLENNEDNVTLYMALIQSHLRGGNAKEAQSVLKEAQSRGLDSGALNEAKAHIEAELGETDAMRATLTRLRGQSRGNAALIARSFILEGELEASLGNIDEALAAYEAADVASPESPALQHAAALALKSERPTHARRLYRTLCRRKPDGPACAQEARLSKEPNPTPSERHMP
jgi:predicted Zn-dependent protease